MATSPHSTSAAADHQSARLEEGALPMPDEGSTAAEAVPST